MGLALFPWRGDRVLDTVVLMLNQASIAASRVGCHIELEYASLDNLKTAVASILLESQKGEYDLNSLLKRVKDLDWEKFNCYLPLELKYLTYAHTHLDLEGALAFFRQLSKEL